MHVHTHTHTHTQKPYSSATFDSLCVSPLTTAKLCIRHFLRTACELGRSSGAVHQMPTGKNKCCAGFMHITLKVVPAHHPQGCCPRPPAIKCSDAIKHKDNNLQFLQGTVKYSHLKKRGTSAIDKCILGPSHMTTLQH